MTTEHSRSTTNGDTINSTRSLIGKFAASSQRQAILLLLPAVGVYAVFALYPMLDVLAQSFMKWNGLSSVRTWVGFDNFREIFFQDPVFWQAFYNTIIWTVMSLIVPPLIGLALAIGLNQNIPGRTALRAVFYLPVIVAPIAVATIWRWLYNPFFGAINGIAVELFGRQAAINWLGNSNIALYAVFAAYIWESVGFSFVLFLAGLQGVSQTLVDAARIDGAGRLIIFRSVTLPALRGTLSIVLVLSLINSLRVFGLVYGMTGGGPDDSTQMLALWAYTQAMQVGNYGAGSAITVVLLLVTIAIVIPYLHWSLKGEDRRK